MNRRSTVVTVSSALGFVLAGCLDRTEPDAGISEPLEVLLYNYREGAVRIAVDAVADGEPIVSATFDLDAPAVVSTTEHAATVPAGTHELAVEASIVDEGTSASKTFEFPFEAEVSAIEIRADPGGRLRIATMEDETPA